MDTPRSTARVMLDIQDAFYRLSDGLGGPAGASEGGRAARDLGNLFGELSTKMPVDHRAGFVVDAVRDMIGDPTWTPPPGRTVTMTATHTVARFPVRDGNCHGLHPYGPCRPGKGCNREQLSLDEVIREVHPDSEGRLPGSDGYQGCCPHIYTSAAQYLPDELVLDDDGPRAGSVRPVQSADWDER